MASDGQRCRFNLSGDTLEILEKLVGGDGGQHNSSGHNPPYFRGLSPDGLLKAGVCERYNEIAVYYGNSDNFAGEDFFFVQGSSNGGFA